jgi:hypothetical protein
LRFTGIEMKCHERFTPVTVDEARAFMTPFIALAMLI